MDAIVTKMEEEKERKKYIQLLLEKRKNNMSYLKRIHAGRPGQAEWPVGDALETCN